MDCIENDEGWKLLEQVSYNGRTLICWHNPENSVISISLFNLHDRPNFTSKSVEMTKWGYPTHFVTDMMTPLESAEIVGLYVSDIQSENYWWENDAYNTPIC